MVDFGQMVAKYSPQQMIITDLNTMLKAIATEFDVSFHAGPPLCQSVKL
jgi:hypothetical protein